MITWADIRRRRRQTYVVGAVFLVLSALLCIGAYFGWFGWVLWGRPKAEPPPVVAEGSEAEEFARRLMETEAKFARDDIKKLRDVLGKLNMAKDSRYRKYADEVKFNRKLMPEPLSALGVANPTPAEALAQTSDLEKQVIVDIYETATKLDKRLHDVYRIFRSCELARLQGLTLQKAYDATDVVAPQHPVLDRAVFTTHIGTTAGPGMQKLKAALSTVRVEIKSILSASARMLDLAAILEPGILGAGSEYELQAGAMPLWGTHLLIERAPDLFRGTTGADPNAFEHEWGRGDGPINKKELDLPVELGLDLSKTMPLPGRKLLARGRGGEWLFVNSWYIIGPFPNPNRKNLEEKFPPEASIDPRLGFVGIDLDASYVGMAQRPVRWEYLATDRRVCFIPHPPVEWAIWYAYTEIWSEEDQDRYCIFGSDDYGKCWINAEEVYVSGVTPHPWIPDRKFAKVKFKKGFNVVLFKLENAWGRTGFSLCVYNGKVEGKDA
jgi:hypothetical protein